MKATARPTTIRFHIALLPVVSLACALATAGCAGGGEPSEAPSSPESAQRAGAAAAAPGGPASAALSAGAPGPRIIVKLRGNLERGLSGALRSTGTGADVDLGKLRAVSRATAALLDASGVRGARPLYPARLRARLEQGLASDADLSEAARRRFPGRALRAAGGRAPLPDLGGTYLLDVGGKSAAEIAQTLAALRADPDVVYAEEEPRMKLNFVPNDPRLADLYGMTNLGEQAAWDTARGSGVVVAVVDSGVDFAHPDIDANVWTNPGEIAGNGIDDDGNGFVDDWRGWDFSGGDNNPQDVFGHGSHVAGTVAAEGNNSTGVVGAAFLSKIMAVRVFDDNGFGNANFFAAIIYAADEGADVINASWGGRGPSQTYKDAVDYAHNLGALFVASAGNDNVDVNLQSPSNVSTAMAVAAVGPTDAKASFSNFGSKIDVAAPGEQILSLESGTAGYRFLSGTSMAAPHVAGLAAQVIGAHPTFTVEQVRQVLRSTAVDLGAPGDDLVFGHGRVNAAAAVAVTQVLEAKFYGPDDGAEVRTATVALTGTARGPGFVRYIVDFGAGPAPTTWTTIRNTTTQTAVGGGDLGAFNPSTLADGLYTVRLRAMDSGGRTFSDQIQIQVSYLAFFTPAPAPLPNMATELKPGVPITITGRAVGPSFQSFRVEWAPGRNATTGFAATGVTLAGGGTTAVEAGTLATWTPAATLLGFHTVRLTVVNAAFSSQATTTVYFQPDLASTSWPRVLDPTAANRGAVPARMANGSTRLILCSVDNFGGNTCWSVSGDGATVGSTALERGAVTLPSAGELDAGAGEEVLLPDHHKLRITRADLTLVRDIVTTRPESFTFDRTSLADLDGDGTAEIVALARDTDASGSNPLPTGSLYVYRSNGQVFSAAYPLAVRSLQTPAGFGFIDAVAADLNGDGRKEIVLAVGRQDFTAYELQARNADGSPYTPWPNPTFTVNGGIGTLSAADLDRDGRSEIIVAESQLNGEQTRVVNSNGVVRPGWPVLGLGRYNAVADLDRDGRDEVIGLAFSPTRIATVRHDGTGLTMLGANLTNPTHPLAADLDGDSFPEIVFGDNLVTAENGVSYNDTRVRAISRTGATVKEWRLMGSGGNQSISAMPAIGELNGDGRVDVAVLVGLVRGGGIEGFTGLGALSVLTTSATFSAATADWALVGRDPQNSRSRPAPGGGGTLPQPATSPSPANAATGVATSAQLGWTAGSGATTHDVYFGTANPPAFRVNQTATAFNPGVLAAGTAYFWRIDEKNATGTRAGTVWTFTTAGGGTLPQPATSPSPANAATGVATSAQLGWTAGSGATSHDVYFGTANPPVFRVNQTGTAFNPGALAAGTVYFWRIDEKNATGTRAGTVWTFTTVAGTAAPCDALCTGPVTFAGPSYQSGDLGTGVACRQTSANLSGANCGNFATGRTFSVNGAAVSCSGGNITLPAKRNGGYCFQASAGNHPWAYFSTW